MGTTSSATSAASSYFTGSSAFSSSLQNAINQAVAIASAPITQLTGQQTTLTNQSDEVTTLNSKFSAVQSDVGAIGQALSSSFNADVSNSSVVSATAGQGASPGSYTIQVNTPGSNSTMMTSTWNDASGSAETYQLSVGTKEYSVTPADNSAASVVAAINSQYGTLVQATVVNVGSNSSPDDRIALQSTSLSSDQLDLKDGSGNDLAAQQTAGAAAQYEVDQSGNVVSSSSSTINIAPGVTVNLLAKSSSPVTVTVTQDTSALSSALSTFVTDYNSAVDEVDTNRGQSGGALQGQDIVNQLQRALAAIGTYSASGGLGLQDLGLQLGQDGHFTFDSDQFASTASTNLSGVDTFLGSATGGGFLQTATNQLTTIEDSTTGLIPTTQTDMQNQLTALQTQIADKQTQVSDLQTQLTAQMSTADASISTMEQQYSYLNEMFQAMQIDAQEITG
jgi:flagellar hook-associated protein 2